MLAIIFSFIACEAEPEATTTTMHPPVAFSAEKATEEAEKYVETLYSTVEYNGPVCLGEKVTERYTQCSFTYMKGEDLFASTILCDNFGCIEGSAPAVVAAENRPATVVENGQDSGIPDDWLFWYLLMNNGGASHSYHTWYHATPEYGRTAYYTTSYRPSTQSTAYYKDQYSSTVKSTATKSFTSKYPTTSRSSTTASTTASTTSSASKTSTSSKSTATTSSKSRSSGWGSSSRSSGYRSSSSRSGRR